ncbi:MAG TPA: hypothetical protein VIW24_09470 [Aldersonia sp.]
MSDTPTAPLSGPAPPLPGQALPSQALPGQALPGQHVPGASPADPQQVRAEVDGLLSRLDDHRDTEDDDTEGDDTDPASSIAYSAEVLEQAHDVLVAALASLDKI